MYLAGDGLVEVVLISNLTIELARRLSQLHWRMSSAESCTGGMIAASCTELPGSSAWFERGFVTYSNESKTQMLGVSTDLIATHGAVSAQVAHAMSVGAVYRSHAQISLAVTGVAGPSGGSFEKPVGTVWFGWCVCGVVSTERKHFAGDRSLIRKATVSHALEGLLYRLPI